MTSLILPTKAYLAQQQRWPVRGRHILAHFDANSIIVYQAYRPAIGQYAVRHQTFGGEFRFSRMIWIKTNFLWMMYRSGWGTKPDQEVTLAIRLQRAGFDQILQAAVHTSFQGAIYPDHATWADALAHSPVRIQWDPDHDPSGNSVERRALQLGLRDAMLERYAREWIIEIEDISSFVAQQRSYANASVLYHQLQIPYESLYPVSHPHTAWSIGVTPPDAQEIL